MMLLTPVGRSEKSMKTLRVHLGSSVRDLWAGRAVAFQVLNCYKLAGPHGPSGEIPSSQGVVSRVMKVTLQLFNDGSFFSLYQT